MTSRSKTDLDWFAHEIQNQPRERIFALAYERFGRHDHSLGSGIINVFWRVAGGNLSLHPFYGPWFCEAGGSWVPLLRTSNPVESCLYRNFQIHVPAHPAGSVYYLGEVSLMPDLTYRATGRRTQHGESAARTRTLAEAAEACFFLRHPEGSFRLEFAPGVGPQTRLETLPEGALVAVVTFEARDGAAVFSLVTARFRTCRRLRLEAEEETPFTVSASWANHWS